MNMLKKLTIVIFLISCTLQAQTYVKGTLNPAEDYSWIVLYQLKGVKQLYIKNVTITNGEFSIEFPKNAPIGIYRLMFSQQKDGFVDFIYNKESIELNFNPANPLQTVKFLTSEENNTYQKYLMENSSQQQTLDSLQVSFFNVQDEIKKAEIVNLYKIKLDSLNKFQTTYEAITKSYLANHFIKSNKKYYATQLFDSAQKYLNSEKQHYFDFIDFTDKELLNATFLSEKVIEYIFYLNGSEDVQMQNGLYKVSVQEVLQRLGNDENLKSELLTLLLHSFAQIENTILIDFIIDNYYDKLPKNLQDQSFLSQIEEKVKLAVGKKAPEITWEENGVTKKLSELEIADNYIVVFWSTKCSHCLSQIPKLYEFTKDKPNIHVIGFALEKDAIGFNNYIPKLQKWTNILGLEKWQNPVVKEYQITATPTYFVLDANKKIIAKPDYFENIKAFFEN
ncbi:MAG: thioredoxin-like domain-containing protein [Lutibacter sp.]|uniref:TlpA family protein disulfide reductase n=1 Tax=Lutibacter sp. TaxID=1925666 RepID=UPI00385EB80C